MIQEWSHWFHTGACLSLEILIIKIVSKHMYWGPMYLESTKTTLWQPRCAFRECQIQIYDFKGHIKCFFWKIDDFFWGGSEEDRRECRNEILPNLATHEQTRTSVSIGGKFSTLFELVVNRNRHVRPIASISASLRHSDDVFMTYSTNRNRGENRTMRGSFLREHAVAIRSQVAMVLLARSKSTS